MCDPVSAFLVLGSVVSAGGAIYQGIQANKAAKANAAVMEQNAQAVRQKAEYDEKLHRERVRKLLSSQRALYGKSGVEMAGSPLLVMEDTAAQGELDALAIRYGGDVEAANYRSRANIERMQGRAAKTAGYIQAGSSLLSAGSKYYDRKQSKVS